MSNEDRPDNRLVPRDYPIPVSARRPMPSMPIPASMDPGLIPPQAAPASPHIIYINNVTAPSPAAATAFVPPAPAPAPIHHHHHYAAQQTTHRISYRVPAAASNSALGMASLALGIIACVVCWVPWLGLVAVPVGAIGALLGLLGVLVSLVFRRSSVGLPLTAVFVCCLAAGISITSTRSLPYWRRQLNNAASTIAPQLMPAARPETPSTPAELPPVATPSLFGSPPLPAKVAQPAPAKPTAIQPLAPSVSLAMQRLRDAQSARDQLTKQSASYMAAVKAADDARSRDNSLRDTSPNSPELIQAGRDLIDADNAVSQILERAQGADPAVVDAENALQTANVAAHK